MQTERGQSIEDASMLVIEEEIGEHHYGDEEWPIVRRVIHATADFDFAGRNRIIFQNDAVRSGMNALRNGCSIVVDVNGVVGGLNKQNLRDFGNQTICNISDPGIAQTARAEGRTRSQAAMRAAADQIDGGVTVIGNAPTALLEVIAMVREEIIRPALVVGIPVGFICAAEAKEELAGLPDTPHITNLGRKGGSPSASAIVNALFKLIRGGSAA